MMRGILRIGLVCIVAVSAVGCDGSAADADPSGRAWLLTELRGAAPLEGTVVDMSLSAEGVSGSSGCNRYFGPATFGSGQISIGPDLAGTMMACADPVMLQEQTFLDTLASAASYQVVDEELRLLDVDGTVIARFA